MRISFLRQSLVLAAIVGCGTVAMAQSATSGATKPKDTKPVVSTRMSDSTASDSANNSLLVDFTRPEATPAAPTKEAPTAPTGESQPEPLKAETAKPAEPVGPGQPCSTGD